MVTNATPQHSVTEQAYTCAQCGNGEGYYHEAHCAQATTKVRAQPLASTAATQPEQASIKTWQERVNLDEYEPERRESVALYEAQREIADLRAALANPAAPSK